MFYQKKGKGKMRNHSRDQKNYHSSFIGKVMKINIQHRKRDKVSETCIDLVDKVVYVKPPEQINHCQIPSTQRERAIRKAIKRSMVLKDQ